MAKKKRKDLKGMTPEERLAHISKELKSSKLGKRAVLAEDFKVEVEYLKSPNLYANWVWGGKGLQFGRMHEIYGPESVGKTTLVLQMVAEAQKQGHTIGWLDAEYSWDNDYAEHNGVDLSKIFVIQEDRVSEGTQAVRDFIEAGVTVVVTDSIAALRPLKEIEDDPSATQFSGNAKAVSRYCYALRGLCAEYNVLHIAINQARINMNAGRSVYDMYRSPGGQVFKHSISSSSLLHKWGDIKDGEFDVKQDGSTKKELVVGHNSTLVAIKNKGQAARGRTRRIRFHYFFGMDNVHDTFDAATSKGIGIISRSGAWYEFINENGKKEKIQGASNVVHRLREDVGLYDYIFALTEEKMNQQDQAMLDAIWNNTREMDPDDFDENVPDDLDDDE